MVARGATAAEGARGRESRSTGGRIVGRGAQNDQAMRRHVTRAALRLNPGLRTPKIAEQQPEIIPPAVPEAFMRRVRNDLANLRRQLEEERLRGVQLEEQLTEHPGADESTDKSDDSDYEAEEEDMTEETSLEPEEDGDSADEHPAGDVQQPVTQARRGRGLVR